MGMGAGLLEYGLRRCTEKRTGVGGREIAIIASRVAASWYYAPDVLRSASRERYTTDFRDDKGGFRVARLMTPSPEPQPFTVVAEPPGARIRIVNIEEPYQAGMALGPGRV